MGYVEIKRMKTDSVTSVERERDMNIHRVLRRKKCR